MNRIDELIWSEGIFLLKKELYGLTPDEEIEFNKLEEELALLMEQEDLELDEMIKQEDYFYDYQGDEVFPWDEPDRVW